MNTNPNFKRQRIAKPGRFAVTIECADNLTEDEIIRLEGVIEAQVCLLQKNVRGYTQEHVAAWQAVA